MKSLLTRSLLLISIQFNDIVNNQSLVRRAPQTNSVYLQLPGVLAHGLRTSREMVS